ncbi:hypothetical protein RchiOBHm_Chr5g0064831 [Rosa chinensis]|uniref:Uncharacterized protein n=1 Tax=Rosa chinensis TaxID=74649 RepID=A0A2P6QIS0_ROSCH|nr:hypothetical protein RchiOBHm_Chr5g0064831 [Rosa chinensis]
METWECRVIHTNPLANIEANFTNACISYMCQVPYLVPVKATKPIILSVYRLCRLGPQSTL